MTTLGVDYAWQHPDPAALAAAGYRFACRYLSRDSSKNVTLAEAQALARQGIAVVANWEYGAQDMLRGVQGGVADAQLALAQAEAAGMPAGRPIYFSADWDVTPAQEVAVSAYLGGADSVLGAARTGEYAGFYPVKIARDGGLAAWSWQTYGWSGGQWDPRDQIRQTGSATVGGVQVDVNQAMTADYGQWFPGVSTPAPAPAPVPILKEHTVHQQLVYDTANRQQHFVYLVGGAVYHRVYDEATSHMSSPNQLPGGAVSQDAGLSAALMMDGKQLHVFAEFADTSHGTGAHYWLAVPADTTKAESWGSDVI